ncbi:MAG: hypothetical protein LBI39_02415 [Puniceicoccales bacterium]|jgi:hypothetical protein|nr:hypothetical protein [Puniceicoccales bacterium]
MFPANVTLLEQLAQNDHIALPIFRIEHRQIFSVELFFAKKAPQNGCGEVVEFSQILAPAKKSISTDQIYRQRSGSSLPAAVETKVTSAVGALAQPRKFRCGG